MTYGKRLESALKHAGKKRKDLAKVLDYTPQAIGMVITGGGKAERRLSFESNQIAAKFLGVREQWLGKGEEPMLEPEAPKESSQQATELPLSQGAIEIALLFDMIPQSEKIRRSQAYNTATSAIIAVIEDHANALPAPGQKKQSA